MTTPQSTSEQLDQIVSKLNHRVTGSLTRVEGLYRLYQQEGHFRDELWEQAFTDAKVQIHELLGQSFALCAWHTCGLHRNATETRNAVIDQAA